MKHFSKLPFCLIFSIAFVAFLSCKKVDFHQNNILVDESKFFSVPENADPIIGRVIAELKKQKEKNPKFIESIVKRNGYPVWDKAQITKQDFEYQSFVSGEDTIIYIPLAVYGEEKVSAFFLATVNDYIQLQLYNKFDYEEFGFDTTGMNNANRLALQFMILDFVTFGHKDFIIHDNRLLKDFQIALDAPIRDRTVRIDYYNDSVYGRGWEIREFYVCTTTEYLKCNTPGVCCSDGSCSLCHNSDCWKTKPNCEKVSSLVYYDAGDPPSGGNTGGGGGGGGTLPGSSTNVELCNPTPLIQNGLPPCPKGYSLGWEPIEPFGFVSVQNVINTINPNFPCLVSSFNDVTTQRLVNCIYQLYNATFVGTDKIHNLEVLSGSPLLDGDNNPVPAKSRVKPGDNNTYQIALNEDMGFSFTKEYWSSIILHELVHGFIQKNSLDFTPTSQFQNVHQIMLISWVNDIKEALLDIYPTMSDQDALCLAINGMSDILTDDVNNTFLHDMTQWMEQYYNVNAPMLGRVADEYRDGIKGTPCN